MKINVNIDDVNLIKNLDRYNYYMKEYDKLLDQSLNLLITNHSGQNDKKIKKIYKRLSELIIIIEFLDSYKKIKSY